MLNLVVQKIRIGSCRYPKTTATLAYSFNSLPTVHTDRSTEWISYYLCVFPFRSEAGHRKVAYMYYKRTVKADSHIACRAHAVPLPCRAAKGLEYVFPI